MQFNAFISNWSPIIWTETSQLSCNLIADIWLQQSENLNTNSGLSFAETVILPPFLTRISQYWITRVCVPDPQYYVCILCCLMDDIDNHLHGRKTFCKLFHINSNWIMHHTTSIFISRQVNEKSTQSVGFCLGYLDLNFSMQAQIELRMVVVTRSASVDRYEHVTEFSEIYKVLSLF